MKHIFIIAQIFLLAVTYGCKKPANPGTDNGKNDNNGETFNVKVEAIFCAYTIVSIQDTAHQKLGMKWNEYDHVFAVSNPCDRPEYIQKGGVYKCKIIDKPVIEGCIVCMGFMDTPPLKRNVLLSR